MSRTGAGKVGHVEKRPENQGKPTLPPDASGNREQRRSAALLARQGRTVAKKPTSAEEMLERIEAMPDWRTVNIRELGRRLGVHPNKARTIRQLLLKGS
jgi:hypothetical protein